MALLLVTGSFPDFSQRGLDRQLLPKLFEGDLDSRDLPVTRPVWATSGLGYTSATEERR